MNQDRLSERETAYCLAYLPGAGGAEAARIPTDANIAVSKSEQEICCPISNLSVAQSTWNGSAVAARTAAADEATFMGPITIVTGGKTAANEKPGM